MLPSLLQVDPPGPSMDPEGFDAVADTVGPGIYGGKVKRDEHGQVVMGRQYQNHNPTPGPVYAGGGYTVMADAIHQGPEAVKQLLQQQPDLIHDVSTGGAMPLHICGMSRRGQLSTHVLIEAGADIHAVDTYGYTPLHRMASNNLAVGAQALVEAGADPEMVSGKPYAGETPMAIAKQSGAWEAVQVLRAAGATR
jgi:hypothetical protein